MQNFASVKTLIRTFGCDKETAKRIREVVKDPEGITDNWYIGHGYKFRYYQPPIRSTADYQLRIINKLLDDNNEVGGFHGVEAIQLEEGYKLKEDSPWVNRSYWFDTVLLYCNNGHTYRPTIAYDVNRDRFLITSWGDWYETNVKESRHEN